MSKKIICLLACLCLLLAGLAGADSIWKSGQSNSPYSTQKAFKVGDIIYVLILETTSAVSKADTGTDVKDELSFSFTHTLDQLAPYIGKNTQVAGKAQNKYKGSGQTTRSSTIKARVSARVIEVLPNGNLKIVGQHKVGVNDEDQEIVISGIIRSKDVSMTNAIYSYQVANAKISVSGQGALGEAQSPGWITRILNWIF